MAKPKKKKATTKTVTADDAAALLEKAAYKEAIDAYKQLLKQEQRPEWQEALGKAYFKRAEELAAKGMYKEATVLWENRASLCQQETEVGDYLIWLLKGNRLLRAINVFTKHQPQLSKELSDKLTVYIAALLLTQPAKTQTEILQALPENSLISQHLPFAQQAITAYCTQDDNSLEEALKKISFRSPYRDLRSILKALSLLATAPEEATTLLERIPTDSPFHSFAALLKNTTLEKNDLINYLYQKTTPAYAFTFLTTVLGFKKEIIKKIQILQKLSNNNPKELFHFAINHLAGEDKALAHSFAYSLMPFLNETEFPTYEKIFGRLPFFDRYRIIALQYEQQRGSLLSVIEAWEECIESLQDNDPPIPEQPLKLARIIKRFVDLICRDEGEEEAFYTVVPYLEELVDLDPTDKEGYLKILALTSGNRSNSKLYYEWVDKTIAQFPQDKDALFEAMKAATKKKAFKKAVGYANTLLKIDPINRDAQNVLFQSHLAHARKQIKAKRYHLVRKELDFAMQVEQRIQQKDLLATLEALLAFSQEDTEKATDYLQQAMALSQSNLSGQMLIVMEAKQVNIEPAALQKLLLKQSKKPGFLGILSASNKQLSANFLEPPKPTNDDILKLCKRINHYRQNGIKWTVKVVEELNNWLAKSTKKLSFSENELIEICETFFQLPHYDLLKLFSMRGLDEKNSHFPMFAYYTIYAVYYKKHYLDDKTYSLLDYALTVAVQRGDEKAKISLLKLQRMTDPLTAFLPPPQKTNILAKLLTEFMSLLEKLEAGRATQSDERELQRISKEILEITDDIPPDIKPLIESLASEDSG